MHFRKLCVSDPTAHGVLLGKDLENAQRNVKPRIVNRAYLDGAKFGLRSRGMNMKQSRELALPRGTDILPLECPHSAVNTSSESAWVAVEWRTSFSPRPVGQKALRDR